jgi:hypothetical protein
VLFKFIGTQFSNLYKHVLSVYLVHRDCLVRTSCPHAAIALALTPSDAQRPSAVPSQE